MRRLRELAISLYLWLVALLGRGLEWIRDQRNHIIDFWRAAGYAGADMKWEFRYAIRYVLMEYPHRIAYVLLGLGCFIALAWGAVLYGRIDDSQREQDRQSHQLVAQQAQITGLVKRIQVDRKRSSAAFCSSMNHSNRALRLIIVNSTKASKALEPVYERLGLPPYPERLRNARKLAATIPRINCKAVLERIERTTPGPRPPAPERPH